MSNYEKQILATERYYDREMRKIEQSGVEILYSVVPGSNLHQKLHIKSNRTNQELPAMKRLSFITSLVLLLSLVTISTAQAQWGGGYYECKRTPLIEFEGTVAEAAIADPFGNLSTLLVAVQAADPAVLDALSDPNAELTVFAPVDAGFAAIPEPILNEILADQGLVTNVLLYHVVDGYSDPREVFYIRKRESLLGQDLFVSRGSSNPSVNQSQIECQGVKTDNGVVWLIDSVLLPQFLQ